MSKGVAIQQCYPTAGSWIPWDNWQTWANISSENHYKVSDMNKLVDSYN